MISLGPMSSCINNMVSWYVMHGDTSFNETINMLIKISILRHTYKKEILPYQCVAVLWPVVVMQAVQQRYC